MSLPSLPQSSREEIVLNFGWPGTLPYFQTSIYCNPPPDSQGRKPCRVFLGPNLSSAHYSNLENLLKDFDNAEFSGLVLTTYAGSLSSGQQQEVLRLIRRQVSGNVELRSVEPTIGHEKVMKRIQAGSRISSSFSIPVDVLNGLPESVIQRLCTLDNLELVHLLPPMRSLLEAGSIDPCRNALETVWKHTPTLRKCILPLDIFDYLVRAFEVLRSNASLEEVELTFPTNDEVLQFLHPQSRSYEPTMACLSPLLAQLKGLKAMTIPITFVLPGFLIHIATLPCLVTLTVTVQVGTVNPVRQLLEALREAPIHKKGPKCFEELMFLDLRSCGQLQHHHQVLDAPESSVQALRTIFVDTIFCGDWLES